MSWIEPNSAARVWATGDDDAWQKLLDEYGGSMPGPLKVVLDVARQNGCRTVIDENRYVDADYRSEYSSFWAQRFDDAPPFARRLHFFAAEVDASVLHKLPKRAKYLGYCVLKPPRFGRVGRTVLSPPRALTKKSELVLTTITDEVSLFGHTCWVSGVPFYQQDGEFIRCAHAAAWVCHYSAWRKALVGRVPSGDLAAMVPPFLSEHRPLPSKGMRADQLQAVFNGYGQPALVYSFDDLPTVSGVGEAPALLDEDGEPIFGGFWDVRMFSIICRYLNSGFPVLIGTSEHAFVLVGWFRENNLIRFVACDDQQGPYEVIDSPFTDDAPPRSAPWRLMMVPLPPKVFLSGEMAENQAHKELRRFKFLPKAPAAWKQLGEGVEKQSGEPSSAVSLRTGLKRGSEYKTAISEQGRSESSVQAMRLTRLPHYVWVVEAQDREKREAEDPACVLAEVVLDSTSHDREPRIDALSVQGLTAVFPPGGDKPLTLPTDSAAPWKSQLSSS